MHDLSALPPRPTLIPRWLLPAVATGLAVVAVGLIAAIFLIRPPMVIVPSVTGLDSPVARSRLAVAGLRMEYGDSRFSSEYPEGVVLEQIPGSGSDVYATTTITVVVSAGSETFEMPDVIGMPLGDARALLEGRGVTVQVDAAPSDAPDDTVIASSPSPGVTVSTGEVVRLTIAGDLGADVLLPGDLTGTVILLDPSPPTTGTADVPMEIARHLRSLLQASGAEVLVARSIVETQATEPIRAAWAAEASPTVAVGISMGLDQDQDLVVRSLQSDPERADVYLAGVELAREFVAYLTAEDMRSSLGLPVPDPVLEASGAPAARLYLGDAQDPASIAAMSDPAWIDAISRAVYRALTSSVPGA